MTDANFRPFHVDEDINKYIADETQLLLCACLCYFRSAARIALSGVVKPCDHCNHHVADLDGDL